MATLSVAERAGLQRALGDPTFELIPLKNVREQAAAIRKARETALADPEGKSLGAALGKAEVEAARAELGLEAKEFTVPGDVMAAWREAASQSWTAARILPRATGGSPGR